MSDTASVEDQDGSSGGSTSEFLVQMENRLPADFPPISGQSCSAQRGLARETSICWNPPCACGA